MDPICFLSAYSSSYCEQFSLAFYFTEQNVYLGILVYPPV